MAGPDPSVSAVRTALRRHWDATGAFLECGAIVVACSGGPDSLALAAAAAHLGPKRGLEVHGTVIDHGLQEGSGRVAQRAATQLAELGVIARVVPVEVGPDGGMEAAARNARYAALRAARPHPDALVLLGHTLDDQAESVLLGLGRGSGARSIAGMRPLDPPWSRPLLDVSRETTAAACRALGLEPWHDPHNTDSRFTRVRLRSEVLPLMEGVLQGGVAAALARTAAQVREDDDALELAAERLRERAELGAREADNRVSPAKRGTPESGSRERAAVGRLDAAVLAEDPAAVRRRVLRGWLLDSGVPQVSDGRLRAADALVGHWRGQGGVALPGGFVLSRVRGRLLLEAGGPTPPNG